jgi:hypothetical protein
MLPEKSPGSMPPLPLSAVDRFLTYVSRDITLLAGLEGFWTVEVLFSQFT